MTSINNHPNAVGHDENPSEGGWVFVEEGSLKGVTLIVNRATGTIISLSTGSCREEDRWEKLPADALRKYPSLEVLDLDKSRYMTEFDASACHLPKLQRLLLTRCNNLRTISPSIGVLQNLTEVRTTVLALILWNLTNHSHTLWYIAKLIRQPQDHSSSRRDRGAQEVRYPRY